MKPITIPTAQIYFSPLIVSLSLLPTSKHKFCLKAEKSGYVNTLDALKIAKGCSLLGGGRQTIDSDIDFSVGTVIYKKIGDYTRDGDTLLEIHYNSEEKLKETLPFSCLLFIICINSSNSLIISDSD